MSRSHVAAARIARESKVGATETVASTGASNPGLGEVAAEAWVRARGATPPTHLRWHVEIALSTGGARPPTEYDETTATRFQLDIYSEEWGVFFCHAGRSSWLRVTDAVFVHGRDDFQLLALLPPLEKIGRLLHHAEQQQGILFQREHAAIRTNVPNVELAVRAWVLSL